MPNLRDGTSRKLGMPSTPHDLIIEAFNFYNQDSPMLPLLRTLLNLNFVTEGTQIFTHGTTGIPMGLPLAPELSRMVTAYLLRDYITPPGEILKHFTLMTVASTFPLPLNFLSQYSLEEGPPNLSSNHPSQKNLYFYAPIHRSSNLASHPREALQITSPAQRKQAGRACIL